jgi:predicted nucleic acid-binding Zn ribbon protein
VVFKGSGFYVTDKSRKAASPAPNGAKKPKEAGTTSTESKPEATKSEKPATKPKSDE